MISITNNDIITCHFPPKNYIETKGLIPTNNNNAGQLNFLNYLKMNTQKKDKNYL